MRTETTTITELKHNCNSNNEHNNTTIITADIVFSAIF